MPISRRLRQHPAITAALVILVAAGAATAARALRQDAPVRGRGPAGLNGFSLFSAIDNDGQAGLSQAEVEQSVAVLQALDKNHDGRVTSDELPVVGRGGFGSRGPGRFGGRREGGDGRGEFEGPRGQGRDDEPGEAAPASADDLTATLMAFDQNKDGKLTRSEVPDRMQGLFDRADANKDGELTADEIRRAAQAQAQTQSTARGRVGSGEREGRDGGRFGREGGPFGGPDPLVRAVDVDGDGALSRDEVANLPSVLRRFDRNADGIVMLQELFAGGEPRR
jgi:Ca2+-binding EF-hand superfamily protein